MKLFNYIMGCAGLGIIGGSLNLPILCGLGMVLVYLTLIWSIENHGR